QVSNAQKPNRKPYSLDRYRSEAKGDPFELWVSDSESIVVERPTGDQMFRLESATSSKEVLRILAGDQADALISVLGTEDAAVMREVAKDLQEHFGLGE